MELTCFIIKQGSDIADRNKKKVYLNEAKFCNEKKKQKIASNPISSIQNIFKNVINFLKAAARLLV